MVDMKKEQERDELHRAIWAIADELRGSVDGWDFKAYVLGMMFYRYISENLTNYINEGEWEAGNDGFDYTQLSDEDAEQARKDMINTKGFFIVPSELFCNVRARAGKQQQTWNYSGQAKCQSCEADERHCGYEAGRLQGQLYRRFRRCLRVPDGYVRIQCWQKRW